MLYSAAVSLVMAIVAAVLGFGGTSAAASEIARTLFFVFLAVTLVTFILGVIRGIGRK